MSKCCREMTNIVQCKIIFYQHSFCISPVWLMLYIYRYIHIHNVVHTDRKNLWKVSIEVKGLEIGTEALHSRETNVRTGVWFSVSQSCVRITMYPLQSTPEGQCPGCSRGLQRLPQSYSTLTFTFFSQHFYICCVICLFVCCFFVIYWWCLGLAGFTFESYSCVIVSAHVIVCTQNSYSVECTVYAQRSPDRSASVTYSNGRYLWGGDGQVLQEWDIRWAHLLACTCTISPPWPVCSLSP